jgi:hypothetical protein
MTLKTLRHAAGRPGPKPVLSSVLRCDNAGQLSVPTQLSLANDGRLYLTGSGEGQRLKLDPQSISLKESVAWFRVAHQCGLNLIHGDSFSEWLRMIEKALS